MDESTAGLKLCNKDIESEETKIIDSVENDFAYRNDVHNSSIKIRMAFIRKVYGLLCMQLLITLFIGAPFFFVDSLKLYTQNNVWPMYTSFFTTMGILIMLHFKRREHPVNLLLLVCFTILQGLTIGMIVSMYDAGIVWQALFMTFTVVVMLTLFTFQTKRDFSSMKTGLFSTLIILILGGVFQIFIQSSIIEFLLGIGGAIVFSLFIIYDTQEIMKTLSPEEYILATINLYLDIINLFLSILRICEGSRK